MEWKRKPNKNNCKQICISFESTLLICISYYLYFIWKFSLYMNFFSKIGQFGLGLVLHKMSYSMMMMTMAVSVITFCIKCHIVWAVTHYYIPRRRSECLRRLYLFNDTSSSSLQHRHHHHHHNHNHNHNHHHHHHHYNHNHN